MFIIILYSQSLSLWKAAKSTGAKYWNIYVVEKKPTATLFQQFVSASLLFFLIGINYTMIKGAEPHFPCVSWMRNITRPLSIFT